MALCVIAFMLTRCHETNFLFVPFFFFIFIFIFFFLFFTIYLSGSQAIFLSRR